MRILRLIANVAVSSKLNFPFKLLQITGPQPIIPSKAISKAFIISKRCYEAWIRLDISTMFTAGVVTSTLHHMLKYPVQGKIIIVHGEEEYMISHMNSLRYVELDGEFIETPFQHFEEVSEEIAATKAVSSIPQITRPPPRM